MQSLGSCGMPVPRFSDPDYNYGAPLPRALKKRVMRAHNGICHVCGKPGSDEIDHILNRKSGGSDAWENLAPIHKAPCHVQKTQEEAQRARNARKRRKGPEHPGRKRKT